MVPTRHAHRTEKNFRSVTERNVKLTPLFGAELPPGGSRSPKIKIKIKAKRHKIALGAPMAPSVHWNARHRRQRTRPMIYELTKKKMSARRVPQPFFFVVRSKRGHLHN